jgi:hypothetical protein
MSNTKRKLRTKKTENNLISKKINIKINIMSANRLPYRNIKMKFKKKHQESVGKIYKRSIPRSQRVS